MVTPSYSGRWRCSHSHPQQGEPDISPVMAGWSSKYSGRMDYMFIICLCSYMFIICSYNVIINVMDLDGIFSCFTHLSGWFYHRRPRSPRSPRYHSDIQWWLPCPSQDAYRKRMIAKDFVSKDTIWGTSALRCACGCLQVQHVCSVNIYLTGKCQVFRAWKPLRHGFALWLAPMGTCLVKVMPHGSKSPLKWTKIGSFDAVGTVSSNGTLSYLELACSLAHLDKKPSTRFAHNFLTQKLKLLRGLSLGGQD